MMTALATAELKTIRVYGDLAKLLKQRTFKAAVRSPQDAIKFLLANFPEVESYILPRFFHIRVGEREISEDDLEAPTGVFEEIRIIPAICGAGGGVGQIIGGVALIAGSFLVPFAAPVLLPLGIGLTLTGIATFLTPTPSDRPESTDPSDSYNFNGLQQTSREGIPVPVVYGEIFTGSVVLSVKVEEDDEELEAEFAPGTGNPNPDPNPVPDPPIPVPSGNLRSIWVISASGTVYGNADDYPTCSTSWEKPSNLYTEFTAGNGPGPHSLVQTRAGSFTLGTAYTSTGCAYYTTSQAGGYSVTRPAYEVIDANGNVIGSFLGNYPTSWGGGAHPASTVWGFVTPQLLRYEQV